MKDLIVSLRLLIVLTLLTGVLYPVALAGAGRLFFEGSASGSLVRRQDRTVGSQLISQEFSSESYFWGRPSAVQFATVASGASNASPTSAALKGAIAERTARFRAAHRLAADEIVPPDLVTTSGSGLDPHVSPAAVQVQIQRVARARGLESRRELLEKLVAGHIEGGGWLGEDRVNVLMLNLALDREFP